MQVFVAYPASIHLCLGFNNDTVTTTVPARVRDPD
jgi:hypothetical protein